MSKKYIIEYKGYREVFADSERNAIEKGWDCTFSVLESLEATAEKDGDIEYCDECESPVDECICGLD